MKTEYLILVDNLQEARVLEFGAVGAKGGASVVDVPRENTKLSKISHDEVFFGIGRLKAERI